VTFCQNLEVDETLFFIGAILCSIALFLFPFSSSLWMAAGLLWVLDAGNNTLWNLIEHLHRHTRTCSTAYRISSSKFLHWFEQTLCNVPCFFSVSFVGTTGNYQLGFLPPFSWCCLFHWICLVEFSTTKKYRLLKKN
jgi:hypothetical protein